MIGSLRAGLRAGWREGRRRGIDAYRHSRRVKAAQSEWARYRLLYPQGPPFEPGGCQMCGTRQCTCEVAYYNTGETYVILAVGPDNRPIQTSNCREGAMLACPDGTTFHEVHHVVYSSPDDGIPF